MALQRKALKMRASPPRSPVSQGKVPLVVEAITVQTGRLVCDVRIKEGFPYYVTPELAGLACARFPDLPHHACVNDEGQHFGDVLDHTSLPHLLEHLAISLLVRSAQSKNASFQGTTEWTSETEGRARIQVSFVDDLEALRAFDEALRFLSDAVLICCP